MRSRGYFVFPIFAAFSLLRSATALGDFESLLTVKRFADQILEAGKVNVTPSSGTNFGDIFSEDVNGNIDVYGEIDGRNASTNIIFSSFAPSTLPSPFGTPVSYNVTNVAVQFNVVSASIILELNYPTLQRTFPLQIDGWFRLNDDSQISAYELIFKRFAQLTDQVVPLLIPSNPRLSTSALVTAGVCQAVLAECTGPNAVYANQQACVSALGTKPFGEWYDLKNDTLICRTVHAQLAKSDPTTFCPAFQATGGNICVTQNYTASVLAIAPEGWLAPKVITPENKHRVGSIQAVSGQDIDPLLDVLLTQQRLHGFDPSLYPTAVFSYMIGYWGIAQALMIVWKRFSKSFKALNFSLQKNVVMYAMNIFFTALALALQLAPIGWAFGQISVWRVEFFRSGCLVISSLYIFELVFRFESIRWPLVCHHIITIFMISFGASVFEVTMDPSAMTIALIWLLQATTEQPTFVALMGYRLRWNLKWVSWLLKVSSIQTFIFKIASAIGVLVFWAVNQNLRFRSLDLARSAMTVMMIIGLMLTQCWGSWVTYTLGIKLQRKMAKMEEAKRNGDSGRDEEEFDSAHVPTGVELDLAQTADLPYVLPFPQTAAASQSQDDIGYGYKEKELVPTYDPTFHSPPRNEYMYHDPLNSGSDGAGGEFGSRVGNGNNLRWSAGRFSAGSSTYNIDGMATMSSSEDHSTTHLHPTGGGRTQQ